MPIATSPSGPGSSRLAAAAERLVVLADLVRLRQVGVEVVLAVEHGAVGDLAAEREAEPDRPLDRLPVRHRQRAREGKADRARVRVLGRAVAGRAAAEHLRPRAQLDVDLEADHRLPGRRRGAHAPVPRRHDVVADGLLERMPDPEQDVLGELRPDELQADGQPVRQAAGDVQARQAGHARRDRQDVGEVHRERVGRPGAERERDGGARRRDEDVEPLEGRVVLAADDRAHLLRRAVVGVVVARRERVRADHDPPLGLVAEAVVTGVHHHLAEVGAVGAQAVAHPVVAGEVRRGLGGRDEVVAGQAVVDRQRQRALVDLGAERLRQRDRRLHGGADARLDPLDLVQLARAPRCARLSDPRPTAARPAATSTVVESFTSCPAIIEYRSAQSRTLRATGPTWSSDEANATTP